MDSNRKNSVVRHAPSAMSKSVTWKRRLRYEFDNIISGGPVGFLILLFCCAVVFDSIISLLTWWFVLDTETKPFLEVLWHATTSMLDPGTFAEDKGFGFRTTMFIATLGGIILVSAIVAILTSTLDGWMHRLRRGRTIVYEEQHTVILGWSTYIVDIIEQIILAHDIEQKGMGLFARKIKPLQPCVTILADMDKADMEDFLREHVKQYKKAKIRCRRGSPIDVFDLRMVNSARAKSIIILRNNGPYADIELMKVLLSLGQMNARNTPQQDMTLKSTHRPQRPDILAEITHTTNVSLLDVVQELPNVQLIQIGAFVSRLIAQSSLQPGLSYVYSKLFDFGDNDIVFVKNTNPPPTFGDAVLMYENGIVIGIEQHAGVLRVNPPHDTSLAPEDTLIVIAFDAVSLRRSQTGARAFTIHEKATNQTRPSATHTLLIGWNWRSKMVIRELDEFVPPGSKLTILVQDFSQVNETENLRVMNELQEIQTANIEMHMQICDTTDRAVLRAHMADFDHVIIMSYAGIQETQHADAHTIMTLSHIRYFLKDTTKRYNIVTEIMDSRNRALMASADIDDFVVSDKIISMYLAQIAHEPRLHAIYSELLTAAGNEIYLKPVEQYVDINTPVTFHELVAAALAHHEVVIGYRYGNVSIGEEDRNEIHINPAERDKPLVFNPSDRLIVIAIST